MLDILRLKTIQPCEVRRCSLTGAFMFGGDWYYEDDETNKAVLYDAYHKRKQQVKEEKFDYKRLMKAQTSAEYKEELKRYEKEVLEMNILTDKL